MTEEIMITQYSDRAKLQALVANFSRFLLRSNTVKVKVKHSRYRPSEAERCLGS